MITGLTLSGFIILCVCVCVCVCVRERERERERARERECTFNLLLCVVCMLTAVKDHEAQADGEEGTHFCSSVFSSPF